MAGSARLISFPESVFPNRVQTGSRGEPRCTRFAVARFAGAGQRAPGRRARGDGVCRLGGVDVSVDELELMPLPDVAERLDLPITRVHQLIRDGAVIAVSRADAPRAIPAAFIGEQGPVKGLPAVITLLRDARYDDEEIVDWLFRADDSLPGTPIQALRENRGTEIKRRAQAAGY